MIADVHQTLQALLTGRGGFDPLEVELLFEPPLKERVNALLRPAICFFLLDMQENTELRQTYRQTVRGEDGAVHRMPPRRFDLRYLVSAFATESTDEQTLLWRTLVLLLQHPILPPDLLPEALKVADLPVSTRMLGDGEAGARPLDYWNALGLPPRPTLLFAVTVPVDLEFAMRVPLVLTRTLRLGGMGNVGDAAEHYHVGGTVRGAEGTPLSGVLMEVAGRGHESPMVTDSQGRFVLAHLQAGEVTLNLRRTLEAKTEKRMLTVPSDRYDITLD